MFSRKKISVLIACLFGGVLLPITGANAQNLLTNNPGFESGPYNFIGFINGWTGFNGNGGYYGSANGFVSGQDGVGIGYVGQEATLETTAVDRPLVATPGLEQFTLTFQAADDGADKEGTASIVFYNAVGTEIFASNSVLNAGGFLGDSYSVTGLAPVGASSVAARISTVGGAQFRVDNFVLSSAIIPEASTITLLAIACSVSLGVLWCRRHS